MVRFYASLMLLFMAAMAAQAQGSVLRRDTVEIFKNKTGIAYKAYLGNWFFSHGFRSSWEMATENHQDSLVMHGPPRYFKVYNNRHRLLFEGGSLTSGGELEGDVIYYYKSGIKKRTEHWDHQYIKDTCNTSIMLHDAPGIEGTWLYFRRNGSLKKSVRYGIAVTSCEPLIYHAIKKITSYRRSGNARKPRTRKAGNKT